MMGEASRRAVARGVDSVALSKLTINRSMPPALVLGVTHADIHTLRVAVEELAGVLRPADEAMAKRASASGRFFTTDGTRTGTDEPKFSF
jgi:hypothetical protein